jgi:type IV secretory pathway TrbD component
MDPAGYRAPIHLVFTRIMRLGNVPRQLVMGTALFCVGSGLALKSWGAVPLFVLLYAIMAYASHREPLWPHILVQAIRYHLKIRRRRHLRLVPADEESRDAPSS